MCMMHVLCVCVHVCGMCPCACLWCVSVCMYVITCDMHVHVYDACALCPCACVWCVLVHVCDYVWYVRAHGFCTLGASAEPLPGDKGLIEGLCSRAALRSCRGPSPGLSILPGPSPQSLLRACHFIADLSFIVCFSDGFSVHSITVAFLCTIALCSFSPLGFP